MKYGFIGFGNMARMLINNLIDYADIDPENIAVSRQNKEKLKEINDYFPHVTICDNNQDVVKNAHMIFLCVKPKDIKEVLREIKTEIKANKHLVYLAPTIAVGDIEKITQGQVTRLIPSITSYCGRGVSLVTHGLRVSKTGRKNFDKTMGLFSVVKQVEEKDMATATILTSCMPGFIGAIFANLIKTLSDYPNSFTSEEIKDMLVETVYGTALLIDETDSDFSVITDIVATKGGLTAEGVKVFDERLPEVYGEVMEKVLAKWQESTKNITEESKKKRLLTIFY